MYPFRNPQRGAPKWASRKLPFKAPPKPVLASRFNVTQQGTRPQHTQSSRPPGSSPHRASGRGFFRILGAKLSPELQAVLRSRASDPKRKRHMTTWETMARFLIKGHGLYVDLPGIERCTPKMGGCPFGFPFKPSKTGYPQEDAYGRLSFNRSETMGSFWYGPDVEFLDAEQMVCGVLLRHGSSLMFNLRRLTCGSKICTKMGCPGKWKQLKPVVQILAVSF